MNASMQRADRAKLTTLLRDLENGRASAQVFATVRLESFSPEECIDLVRHEVLHLGREIKQIEAHALAGCDVNLSEYATGGSPRLANDIVAREARHERRDRAAP
jgi:hypothetical protein